MRLNYNGQLFYYTAHKYKPTNQNQILISVQDATNAELMTSEYWGKIINNMHLPSYGIATHNYSTINIKNDLEFLNARLDYLRKTITYWDAYQIQGSINTKDDISSIDSLEIGRSLIINTTETFTWKNQICSRGGVFVNTYDQGIIYVPPQAAGIYKPEVNYINIDQTTSETSTSHMSISYKFSAETPQESIQEGPFEVPFSGQEQYYNISGTVTQFQITFNSENSNIIPIIQFFYKGEEIWVDYTWTGNNTISFMEENDFLKQLTYKVK